MCLLETRTESRTQQEVSMLKESQCENADNCIDW